MTCGGVGVGVGVNLSDGRNQGDDGWRLSRVDGLLRHLLEALVRQ